MKRSEAQNYKKRARRMIYQDGVGSFVDRLSEDVIRKLIICDDYQRMSAEKVAMLHGKNGNAIRREYIYKWCGRKAIQEEE